MSSRLIIALTLIFLLVQPVAAGGWTVVTLDELPANVRAGEAFTVGFMVRQHGQHPVNVEEPAITAYHPASGETLYIAVRQEGETGHYVAEIVLPLEGRWTWIVHPAPFPDAPMPDLDVATLLKVSAAKSAPPAHWRSAMAGPVMLGALPLFYQRQPLSWRNATVMAAAVTVADHAQTQETANTISAARTDSLAASVTTGKALFVAKGCATCHVHEALDTRFSIQVGPALTDYTVVPEYVRIWLKDPRAIKPATEMPQLDLSESEIEALITFLSAPSE
jgi:cytochrome c2